MGRKKGICSICGKGAKLSLEHVPPQCAGNNQPAEIFNLLNWERAGGNWAEMLGGRPQQEGVGYSTICEDCNRYSGTHYVPEFCRWTAAGFEILKMLPVSDLDKSCDLSNLVFEISRTRPLRFVKEIAAIMLALNGTADEQFRTDNQPLVDLH